MEWCMPLEVLRVYICTKLYQELYVLELFVDDCKMERRRIEVVRDIG